MKSRIKVLLVSPYSSKKVGGIGTWSKNITDYSGQRSDIDMKFQNTVTCIKGNIQSNTFLRLVIGLIDSAQILIRLLINLIIFRPDVVHYTSSASWALHKDLLAVFLTRLIFHKKFIIHWHCGRISDICEKRNKEYSRLLNVLQKVSYSIVLDQKSYQAILRAGIVNVVQIANPISEELRKRSASLSMDTCKRNPGQVLFIGHIIRNKGVFELVKACVQISSVKELLLIGPYTDDVKLHLIDIARRREDGNWLIFKGELRREDVFAFYRSSCLLCLPSYTEGFPYVILEAMSNQCPIIATNVGAIPEILDSHLGICIPTHNIEKLKDAIIYALTHYSEIEEMGSRAYKKVIENYTLEVVYDKYYRLWQELA